MVISFVGAADKGLDISRDMLVVEAGHRCGAFGDIVEFSHEELGFEESPIDAGGVRKCLEIRQIRLLGENLKLIALTFL